MAEGPEREAQQSKRRKSIDVENSMAAKKAKGDLGLPSVVSGGSSLTMVSEEQPGRGEKKGSEKASIFEFNRKLEFRNSVNYFSL